TVFNKEELIRTAAGRDEWVLVIKAPLRDREGNVTGLVGISRNIQKRKETEDALRASEERFRSFFETTTAGMAELTPDGHFLRANGAFCRMTGYSQADLLGMTIADTLFHEEREQVLAQYGRIGGGQVSTYEADRRYRR